MNNDVSIRQTHLRFLVTEIFQSLKSLYPHFMGNYFKNNFFPYDLRKGNILHLPPAHSTWYGINSVLF